MPAANKLSAQSGRPRKPETDEAIFSACVLLLSRDGFDATTIDAVASESGVSRPTIYRRYADRNELIEAAVTRLLKADVDVIDPSSDPERLVLQLLENTCHMLTATPIGGILRNAIPVLDKLPEIARIVGNVAGKRRSNLKSAVKQAMAEGIIDAKRDADVICDALSGAIYSRFLISRKHLDRPYVRKLWQEVALSGP